jgi:hypothetical protein
MKKHNQLLIFVLCFVLCIGPFSNVAFAVQDNMLQTEQSTMEIINSVENTNIKEEIEKMDIAEISNTNGDSEQTQDEMPKVKNMIFEENFDGNNLSSTWVFHETDGEIKAEDEALKITRSSNTSSETIADLYMDKRVPIMES